MTRRLLLTAIGILILHTGLKSQNKWGFNTMVNALIANDVDTISSNFLMTRMGEGTLVLFDAREPEEFQVSHINGAQCIGYEKPDYSLLNQYAKDTPIVVYCSVGKRSEDIGRALRKKGYTNVYNLFGGIFDWTNRGFSVVDEGGREVKKVHPFDAKWGMWVNNYEKEYGAK